MSRNNIEGKENVLYNTNRAKDTNLTGRNFEQTRTQIEICSSITSKKGFLLSLLILPIEAHTVRNMYFLLYPDALLGYLIPTLLLHIFARLGPRRVIYACYHVAKAL